jgi:hypothetical protein
MSALVKVKGTILRETELALLLRQEGETRETWIPRGQCHHISRRLTDDDTISAVIELPEWLAEAKELEIEP